MQTEKDEDRQDVKITGISIPFMDLVVLFVRAGVAAIPALMLVAAVVFAILVFARLLG